MKKEESNIINILYNLEESIYLQSLVYNQTMPEEKYEGAHSEIHKIYTTWGS